MENIEKNQGKPIKINKEFFLKNITNNLQNLSEWNYLGDKPAIVDFYAEWCGPCKMIAPYLDEIAAEYKDQIHVYKVDIDQERELAATLGISSVPTLFFIPVKEQVQMLIGAFPKESLVQAIREFF